MILKTHITDNELRAFFESAGYTCEIVNKPIFHKRTHGFEEEDEQPVLHVQTAGGLIPAEELINEYVKVTILRPVAETSMNIDQAARNLKRK